MIRGKDIIGELLAEDYRLAEIFRKYGIDFCRNGSYSIGEVCRTKGIDEDMLIRELLSKKTLKVETPSADSSWLIDHFADYIERKHHRYAAEKIPLIRKNLLYLCRSYGKQHPELLEVAAAFQEIAEELSIHMKREELVLFPFIRELAAALKKKISARDPLFGSVQNPVQMMMYEHDTQGEQFRKIAELTYFYSPPEDACAVYRQTLSLLKAFEEDLHVHIHLENNILFPKAIEMEKNVRMNIMPA